MSAAREAARHLLPLWQRGGATDSLPAACRPADRAAGYAVQAELAALTGQSVVGWKIAATSQAGQQHIGVDGPLAGRLLADRLLAPGASVPIGASRMSVVEAEFAFRMDRALPPRLRPWTQAEVMAAVADLHPAIEIPDSRYHDFARVGAPQLIADFACACWLAVGPAMAPGWREVDLAAHPVQVWRAGEVAARGQGANVLGDPRIALTWIANELSRHGPGLKPGDLVTTGTCIVPLPVAPGDRVRADYGPLGAIEVALVA
jgi:2-keto-4-pentenoate hydratase